MSAEEQASVAELEVKGGGMQSRVGEIFEANRPVRITYSSNDGASKEKVKKVL